MPKVQLPVTKIERKLEDLSERYLTTYSEDATSVNSTFMIRLQERTWALHDVINNERLQNTAQIN